MRPNEHDTHDDTRPHTPRRSFELFFFESSSNGRRHTYLRFTSLGVIVILLLTIIPLVTLLILLVMNSRRPATEVNTNIRTLPAPSPANSPIIREIPPMSLPRNSKRPE